MIPRRAERTGRSRVLVPMILIPKITTADDADGTDTDYWLANGGVDLFWSCFIWNLFICPGG